MRRTQTPRGRALRRVLLRALLVPVLALVAVLGYLVTSTALAADGAKPPVTSHWRDGYSEAFPGCVASVLWPERETPAGIVVRWKTGTVQRVGMHQVSRQVFDRVRAGDAEIIGACYRR